MSVDYPKSILDDYKTISDMYLYVMYAPSGKRIGNYIHIEKNFYWDNEKLFELVDNEMIQSSNLFSISHKFSHGVMRTNNLQLLVLNTRIDTAKRSLLQSKIPFELYKTLLN